MRSDAEESARIVAAAPELFVNQPFLSLSSVPEPSVDSKGALGGELSKFFVNWDALSSRLFNDVFFCSCCSKVYFFCFCSVDENSSVGDTSGSEKWKRTGKLTMAPLNESGGLFQASDQWNRGGTRIADVRWVFSSDLKAAQFLTSRYEEFSDG